MRRPAIALLAFQMLVTGCASMRTPQYECGPSEGWTLLDRAPANAAQLLQLANVSPATTRGEHEFWFESATGDLKHCVAFGWCGGRWDVFDDGVTFNKEASEGVICVS